MLPRKSRTIHPPYLYPLNVRNMDKESCRGHLTCGSCSQKDLDNMEEDYLKLPREPPSRTGNIYQENHLQELVIYTKEREIMEVKYISRSKENSRNLYKR